MEKELFDKEVERITTRKAVFVYIPCGDFAKYADFLKELSDGVFDEKKEFQNITRLKMEYIPNHDFDEIENNGVIYLERAQSKRLLPNVEVINILPKAFVDVEKQKFETTEQQNATIVDVVNALYASAPRIVDATYKQNGIDANPVGEKKIKVSKFY